ncbi:MAG: translation initiation factor IF-2 [Planctomycetota bacterium]
MAIRLYHLATELRMSGSELWSLLRQRGLELPSVMTILDDAASQKARAVASGEVKIQRPEPGKTPEISLPPPVVPAPARSVRPVAPPRPAKRTPAAAQRLPQSPRRGIKIFRAKETRERKAADKQKGEDILSGRTIAVTVPIALKDFSQQIGVKTSTLLLHLMKQGVMANPNTSLDEETVLVLAEAFKRTVDVTAAKTVEEELEQLLETREAESDGDLKGRPPVVTVLGHVDHGKTSLLDHIRKTRVAAGEAGGITQHIGAYRVDLSRGKSLTFLDTPGHEAFTAMRARGAKITDIAILVVAADDGVMPQTEEAIAHVRAAQVPIVVAINKCDRSNAQPERARQQLSAANLMPEEWGGDVAMINVSAVTGDGIKELLERVSLEAELLDLHASPDHPAEGYVVEARKQTGKGVVATLLVKNGTLHRGDYILSGTTQGKIKSLMDDRGKQVKNAGPSMPVEVTGFDDVPEAGWRFQVLRDKELAKKVASERSQRQRELDLASKAHTSFEKLMDRIESRELPELRLVVKADVKGSLEALKGKLEAIGTDEVQVKILHTGVGGVTESDVLLAQASEALVLGFHVVPDGKARQTAERTGVEIRTSQVIYELLEDMQKAVEGLLPTETEEVIVGHAEIRQLFRHRRRNIAGCMVTDGVARRDARVRLSREGRVILDDAELDSLRRFKDDAKEVKEGFDCGLMIAGYDDVKEGDVLEFYSIEERQRTL